MPLPFRRFSPLLAALLLPAAGPVATAETPAPADAAMLRRIYSEALVHGRAYSATALGGSPATPEVSQESRCPPTNTLRCVLSVNEENGSAGAHVYASAAKSSPEKHLLALESDNGGFQPRGFNLGNTRHDAHLRAARWAPLFAPYGVTGFEQGPGGTDVAPLLLEGVTVGEMRPDSQRYFDYHHTRIDTLDHVNPRELELGAAALASLLWLVDTQGL